MHYTLHENILATLIITWSAKELGIMSKKNLRGTTLGDQLYDPSSSLAWVKTSYGKMLIKFRRNILKSRIIKGALPSKLIHVAYFRVDFHKSTT